MNDLELNGITKRYGDTTVLADINLTAKDKEFIVVVGPSGCGKSTLLKSIAGLESIDSGQILIGGRDVTREEPGDRDIAMVFQSYALYPHMTVAENMGFGLRMAGRPKAEIQKAVKRAAEILQINDYLAMRPRQLSGGQRQRVAIGRAITRSPSVFLFDEPLSNLDAALRTQMRVEIGLLYRRLEATMVYVTHDQVEAMTMATRIVLMNHGVVEQIGTPVELYTNPRNRFVAGFLGSPRMNFISTRAVEVADGSAVVDSEGLARIRLDIHNEARVAVGDEVVIGLRPESIRLDGQGDHQLSARIGLIEQLGREAIAYLDAAPVRAIESENGLGHLTAQTDGRITLRRDDAVSIGFDAADVYLFDAEGKTLTSARTADIRSEPEMVDA
ncbi:ABC transporter ATP-binding protein [Salinisphaera sp. Q1T1-3]|uniref:ABC transporter ATP-binding protein n=1 Tax=Salinisphaera sp. Q1T1-3 TaxID=2321229 RepID=UPI000E7379CF|nr:sn-glycerol-3-phosphate ABC transporter ATP-binding protein UgpC [Salinisphaera sp. Q1T1-3]RJS93486.1 sn-glycerol-3-phosphate ABC transporter ATP-binding protein UgpC [Salinisphaera sp. Q1T1-3]